jgi:hypothetical protein
MIANMTSGHGHVRTACWQSLLVAVGTTLLLLLQMGGSGAQAFQDGDHAEDSKPLARQVTYDHRALIVDGRRQLLHVGAVHYPRSTPGRNFPHKKLDHGRQTANELNANCL